MDAALLIGLVCLGMVTFVVIRLARRDTAQPLHLADRGDPVPIEIVYPTMAEADAGKEKLRACVSNWTGHPALFVEDSGLALIVALHTVALDDRGFQLQMTVHEVLAAPAGFEPDKGIERSCGWNQPYMSFHAGGVSAPFGFYLHFGESGVACVRERWASLPPDGRRYDSTTRGFLRGCF